MEPRLQHQSLQRTTDRRRARRFSLALWLAFILPALALLSIAHELRAAPNALQGGACLSSSLVVTSTADSGAGTLRQALVDLCPDGVITFAPELTASGPATITLTSGELTVDKAVTIDGPGAAQLAISGNRVTRILFIDIGARAKLAGLTLRDGKANSCGAINNMGSLTVTNSSFLSNTVTGMGGGICSSDAALTVIGGDFRNNKAGDSGGGIYADLGTLTVTGAGFINNSATMFGGAIRNLDGTLSITGATFLSNTAMFGGGLISGGVTGTLTLADSTFTANRASFSGGAILNGGTLTATRTAFSGNVASSFGGGAIHNGGVMRVRDSTFVGNLSYADGGGLYNGGWLEVTGGELANNAATRSGGGLYNGGWLTVTNSTVQSGTANLGGGLYNDRGWALLTGATIAANMAISNGGAIGNNHTSATLSIVASSLLSNNTQANGGAISNIAGAVSILTSTLTANAAQYDGGAISNITGTVSILASVLTANAAQYEGGAIVTVNGALNISDSTLGANTATLGGGIRSISAVTITSSAFVSNRARYGGALYNDGLLAIAGSRLEDNAADNDGGAIMNYAILTMTGSTLIGNTAIFGGGGGVRNYTAVMTITHSTFVSNTASYGGGFRGLNSLANVDNSALVSNTATASGGGIDNEGSSVLTLNRSTLAGNRALNGDGGAIRTIETSTLHVTNSTLSDNHAGAGGGIAAPQYAADASTVHVTNSTLTGNGATLAGGGIWNGATLHLHNTIIAGSAQGGDCAGSAPLATNLNNLIQDGACTPALQGDPLLGPLAQNGGPTATRALLPGSPAIDAGDATTCATLATDQRGAARPQGAACDIGAFEARGYTLAVQSGDQQHALIGQAFGAPLVVGVGAAPVVAAALFTDPVAGGSVVFTAPAVGAGALPSVYTATITGASAVYTPTANLATGSYSVTAGAIGAHAPVTFTLTNQVATTTRLATAPNPSAVGETILFTATVSSTGAAIIPTGVVTFAIGGSVLGVVTCDATGVATASTGSLVTGTHTVTARYGGDVGFTPSAAAPLVQQVQPLPTARNDAAGALAGGAVTIHPLANDLDPASGGLTVASLGQANHGVAQVDAMAVRYTPDATFAGVDAFTYTVRDSNGRTASALVAVVVGAPAETDTPPQIGVIDNATGGALPFTHAGGTVNVQVPAGSYTGTLGPADIVYLAFTALADEGGSPPPGLRFGGLAFDLTLFVNDALLPSYYFPQPLTLVIAYDPMRLVGLEEPSLTLLSWDGQAWSSDGVILVSRDLAAHTLTVTVAHLSRFALFAPATPTALEPAPEPEWVTNRHYLPLLSR
jgi:predicted outer membrane repeat protein